jgi:hypothetical protein
VDPQSEYAGRVAARLAARAMLDTRHRLVGYARVLVAVVGLAVVVTRVVGAAGFSGWWVLTPLPPLVFLGEWLHRLESRADALSRAIAFYERAIARLAGGWAGMGPSGLRFLDEEHVYARDLDLFGEGSLFDLIASTRTTAGEETLAGWLLTAAPAGVVRQRQEAVRELGPRLEFHEQLAMVPDSVRTGVNRESLSTWAARPLLLQSPRLRAAAWLLSGVGVLAIAAIVTYLLGSSQTVTLDPGLLALCRAGFLGATLAIALTLWRFKRLTDPILHGAEAATANLMLLANVLRIVEAEPFQSARLIELQSQLQSSGRPPSWRIAQLNRLMVIADMRHNWFVKILGPYLLFDLHVAFRLEDWRRRSGRSVAAWLAGVGEIEALASLSQFHYGHPRHAFPELVEEERTLEGTALGHPLLDEAVTNDCSITPPLQVLIVSGSNMSGKSTFLRTIGVNVVLAQAGSAVYASRMRLSPIAVAASIRILDSLREGRSRFYAEVLRLRQIMDAARAGPALFLIDEFLQGTNSHDRLIGATAIVRGLVERGAIGLITTHDLALTQIAETLGPKAGNVHFQDEMHEGQLVYDHRLRPGIVSRSNALELMRSVGLEV